MASSSFLKAHEFTAKWEGGISDHPADRGGLTAYGASFEFIRDIASTPAGRTFLSSLGVSTPVTRNTILNLTREQVQSIFRHEFWDYLKLDLLPYRQALLLYDAAVNHGPKQGVKLSQRGCNACLPNSSRLDVDGLMGPKTRAALSQDTDCMARQILEARRNFYKSLVASKPSQKVFLKGWLNRANDLELFAAR